METDRQVTKARLAWSGETAFIASDTRGHAIVLDTKTEAGGGDSGIQPADLILHSLAGCMAYDMVSILKKKRADVRRLVVEVEGERHTVHPKRYVKIALKIRTNPEVKPEDVKRAFELSRDNYCSVLATLQTPPEVVFDVGAE